jgi:ketosteroid isomerase-like protein
MSAENKELIQRINKAFSEGNTEVLLENLADDACWNVIGITSIVGKKNIAKEMQKHDFETTPVVTVKNIIAEGDAVMVESTGRATRKTGIPYMALYRDVYRLKDGKIKEFTTYVIEVI